MADQDQALLLIEQNLRHNPNNIEDQRLKASVLALRPSRRDQAVKILEPLASANLLDADERFKLAQLILSQGEEQKYQDEIFKLLKLKTRSPQHLAHFVNYWIGRSQFNQADRWLAELKKAEPQGVAALELEARLLDLRKHKPQLLALLEARGREVPDQIGFVADLLNRYGFTKEAEEAYKAFIARKPRQPERALALAQFLARQDRVAEAMAIFQKAWSTCRPEQVATASLSLYDAPSVDETQRRQVEAWAVQAVQQRPDSAMFTANWGQSGSARLGLMRRRRCVAASWPATPITWERSTRWPGCSRSGIKARPRRRSSSSIAPSRSWETIPSLVDTRAVAWIKSGQVDQAVEELLAIRKQAPQEPHFAFHLAWAYHAKGQTEQARMQLQEAEKLGLRPQSLDPLELAVFQRLQKELFPG